MRVVDADKLTKRFREDADYSGGYIRGVINQQIVYELWSGLYSESDEEEGDIGNKLIEGDTIYLLGVEGEVRYECGAWGWGSVNYVPWEELEKRVPHNNRPTFCYCDNFISFWELKWMFDDGNEWDGVPFIKHGCNIEGDMKNGTNKM